MSLDAQAGSGFEYQADNVDGPRTPDDVVEVMNARGAGGWRFAGCDSYGNWVWERALPMRAFDASLDETEGAGSGMTFDASLD